MARPYVFDRAYYERFYGYPRIRASDRKETALRGAFVASYLRYLEQPVRRVLDMGCGFGLWREVVAGHFPRASYTGVEASDFLCERFGWVRGSVVDFEARGAFDLVICSDVLQYLSDAEASAAIGNLGRLCRGALFLGVLTRRDWEENCDREATHGDVFLRSGDWYRRRLRRHFVPLGGSLFLSSRSRVVLWELDQLE